MVVAMAGLPPMKTFNNTTNNVSKESSPLVSGSTGPAGNEVHLQALLEHFTESRNVKREMRDDGNGVTLNARTAPRPACLSLPEANITDDEQALRTALAAYTLDSPSANDPNTFAADIEHSLQSIRVKAEQKACDFLPPSPKSPLPLPLVDTDEPGIVSGYFALPLSPNKRHSNTLSSDLANVPQSPDQNIQGLGLLPLETFDATRRRSLSVSSIHSVQSSQSTSETPTYARAHSTTQRPSSQSHASRSSSRRSSKSQGHRRRGSVVSMFGLSDLGSTAPHAAPPALSQMSVGVLHAEAMPVASTLQLVNDQTSDRRLSRSSHASITDLKATLRLPLPDSLTSSAMSRVSSAPVYGHRPPALNLSPSDGQTSVAGGFENTTPIAWPTSRRSQDRSEWENDSYSSNADSSKDDPDQHPLYRYISTSEMLSISEAWQSAGMILLPPRDGIPPESDLGRLEAWVRSHAFVADPEDSDCWNAVQGGKQAVLTRNTVTLQTAPSMHPQSSSQRLRKKASNLLLRRQASSSQMQPSFIAQGEASSFSHTTHSRNGSGSSSFSTTSLTSPATTLKITGETLVYRRPRRSQAAVRSPRAFSMREKRSSSRLRTPKWLQRHSFSRSSLSGSHLSLLQGGPPDAELEAPLERVRLVTVDGQISPLEAASALSEARTSYSKHRVVAQNRQLFEDIAYFVQNDYDDDNQTILEGVFREMASLSHKFASQYRYVKGYETYTAQRVRRGILDKIWGDLIEILFSAETKLFQMVENIVMGFLHHTIFVDSLQPIFAVEDAYLAEIIARYQTFHTAEAFGLPSHIECSTAIDVFNVLADKNRRTCILIEADMKRLRHLLPEGDETLFHHLQSALTPFDILTVIRQTIDALVKVADTADGVHGTSLDDLLPLLAFTIVQCEASDHLETILFYVQHFTQSSLGPEFEWSLATFQAAVSWLKSDPLADRKKRAAALSPDSSSKRPASVVRRHTDDGRSQSPVENRKRAPRPSHLYRCDLFGEQRPMPSSGRLTSAASKSSPALVELDDSASLHARRERADKHVPVPIATSLVQSRTPLSPAEHTIKDDGVAVVTISPVPMSRTEEHALSASVDRVQSADMRRGVSEGTGRNSFDFSTWMRSPLTEQATMSSPRSSSPAVSDVEESGSWFGNMPFNRRRLSSVTSIGSSSSFEAMVRSKLFEGYNNAVGHRRAMMKGRALSVDDSALDLKSHIVEDVGNRGNLYSSLGHNTFNGSRHKQRPLSIASMTSSDSASASEDGHTAVQPVYLTSPLPAQSQVLARVSSRRRSGRLRHDLLSSQTQNALAPHMDLSNVISYSNGFGFKPVHSPIREHYPSITQTSA